MAGDNKIVSDKRKKGDRAENKGQCLEKVAAGRRSMMFPVEVLSLTSRSGRVEVVANALIYSLSPRGPSRVASSSRYQVDGGKGGDKPG